MQERRLVESREQRLAEVELHPVERLVERYSHGEADLVALPFPRRLEQAHVEARRAHVELGTVAGELEKALGEAESVNAVWQPVISTEVDEHGAESIMKLIATLEDDDDVQNVFTNFDVDEEILAKLTAA
jgi:transcriptional/translational regulatory protein YebC/TACO1